MKAILISAALLGLSNFAIAENCDTETHFAGPAAVELYSSLNIPETAVRDEHGGSDYALAKYGKLIGCQKTNGSNNVECWIIQPFLGRNCD